MTLHNYTDIIQYDEYKFRYDLITEIVEWVEKADEDEIEENNYWKEKHNGHGLFDIDESGMMIINSTVMEKEIWEDVSQREDFLSDWVLCQNLNAEINL